MATVKKKPKSKKRKKAKRSYKKLETVDVFDGDVQLFRTAPSGKFWQFQMWIPDEKKYVRKSTKTRNRDQAIIIGKKYYLETHAKIINQTPVFPPSAKELADEYLEQKKKDVGHLLTEQRWSTIRTQLRHWLEFVGPTTKMNEIKNTQYDDYYSHRRSTSKAVNTTLIQERGTIRAIYRWAISREMIHDRSLPEFSPLKKGTSRRRLIDVEEYRAIYQYLRSDKFLKNCPQQDRVFRKQLLYLAIVLSNTGMRIGECRRLTWSGVKRIHKEGAKTRSQWSVEILLQEHQTKNGKERTVQGRRGDVFVDLKKLTDFTKRTDFVFAEFHTGKSLPKDHRNKIYDTWNRMLKETRLDQHEEPPTFYHLRHFYATQRIRAGVKPYFLTENMGCSMKYLQDHYGHADTSVVRRDLLKKANYDSDGVLIVDA